MTQREERPKVSTERLLQVVLHGSDEERVDFVGKNRSVIRPVVLSLINVALDDVDEAATVTASLCLAKLSEDENEILGNALNEESGPLRKSFGSLLKSFDSLFDQNPLVLKYQLGFWANLTRQEKFKRAHEEELLESGVLDSLSTLICNSEKYKVENVDHVLLNLVLNISRFSLFIKEMIENKIGLEEFVTGLIKSFEKSADSQTRLSLLAIVVNLLLTGEAQETLLDERLELIPKLLVPLAGPTEELYDEEDMARLPLDIQYLPPGTEREKDDQVRDSLVSCLLLCSNTKFGRETLTKNGVYLVLRELHKWEPNPSNKKRIEDVVDILIKDEDEYDNHPDLLKVDIPNDLLPKLDEMDKELLTL